MKIPIITNELRERIREMLKDWPRGRCINCGHMPHGHACGQQKFMKGEVAYCTCENYLEDVCSPDLEDYQ